MQADKLVVHVHPNVTNRIRVMVHIVQVLFLFGDEGDAQRFIDDLNQLERECSMEELLNIANRYVTVKMMAA